MVISHLRRGRCGSREDVVDAIGDVLVMIDQLRTEPFMADELDASVALKCGTPARPSASGARLQRGSGMNSAPMTCPRLGRVISSGGVLWHHLQHSLPTGAGALPGLPCGQRLAMTCPFYTKMHAVPDQGATCPAEAALREVCASCSPLQDGSQLRLQVFVCCRPGTVPLAWPPRRSGGGRPRRRAYHAQRPWGIACDAALTRFVEVRS